MMKTALRQKLLLQREAQKPAIKKKKDSVILKRLAHFAAFRDAKVVFIYLDHRSEVATDQLIKRALRNKRVIVPKIEKKKICLYEIKDGTFFRTGTFGIREPLHCMPLSTFHIIECALIPGIAFDASGHRIGFGGGYFDRLLKKLKCSKIGLAYEFQIIDKVLTHQYDVPVDYIITEKRIILGET